MPYSYEDIKAQYQRAAASNPVFADMGMDEFAKALDASGATHDYSEGYQGRRIVKDIVGAQNTILHPIGEWIGQNLGNVASSFSELAGHTPETDWGGKTAEYTKELPFMAINAAEFAIPVAGPAIAGAHAALDTYAATDSALSAAIVGGATVAAPVVGGRLVKAGLPMINKLLATTAKAGGEEFAVTAASKMAQRGEKAIEFALDNIGMIGTNKAAQALDMTVNSNNHGHYSDLWSPDALLHDAVSVAGFLPLTVPHMVGGKPSRSALSREHSIAEARENRRITPEEFAKDYTTLIAKNDAWLATGGVDPAHTLLGQPFLTGWNEPAHRPELNARPGGAVDIPPMDPNLVSPGQEQLQMTFGPTEQYLPGFNRALKERDNVTKQVEETQKAAKAGVPGAEEQLEFWNTEKKAADDALAAVVATGPDAPAPPSPKPPITDGHLDEAAQRLANDTALATATGQKPNPATAAAADAIALAKNPPKLGQHATINREPHPREGGILDPNVVGDLPGQRMEPNPNVKFDKDGNPIWGPDKGKGGKPTTNGKPPEAPPEPPTGGGGKPPKPPKGPPPKPSMPVVEVKAPEVPEGVAPQAPHLTVEEYAKQQDLLRKRALLKAAEAVPGSTGSVADIARVAESEPTVAADPTVKKLNDKGIKKKVEKRVSEGTPAETAVVDVVRGAASSGTRRVEQAFPNAVNTKPALWEARIKAAERAIAALPEDAAAAYAAIQRDVMSLHADSDYIGEAQSAFDRMFLKLYKQHDLRLPTEAEMKGKSLKDPLPDRLLTARNQLKAKIIEGVRSHRLTGLKKDSRIGKKESMDVAGMENKAPDQNLGKMSHEELNDAQRKIHELATEKSNDTSIDIAAKEEQQAQVEGWLRDKILQLDARAVPELAKRANPSDDLRRAALIVHYFIQNPERIASLNRTEGKHKTSSGIDLKTINDILRTQDLGYLHSSGVSRFVHNTFKDVLRAVYKRQGIDLLGVREESPATHFYALIAASGHIYGRGMGTAGERTPGSYGVGINEAADLLYGTLRRHGSYTAEEAAMAADSFKRAGSLFSELDVTNPRLALISRVAGDDIAGYHSMPKDNPFAAIIGFSMPHMRADHARDYSIRMQLVHEQWHNLTRQYEQGMLTPEKSRIMGDLELFASKLNRDSMLMDMQAVARSTFTDIPSSDFKQFFKMLDYSTKSPQEYVATMMGMLAHKLIDPRMDGRPNGAGQKLLSLMPHPVAKAALLMFEKAKHIVNWVRLTDPASANRIQYLEEALKNIARTGEEISDNVARINSMQKLLPEVYMQLAKEQFRGVDDTFMDMNRDKPDSEKRVDFLGYKDTTGEKRKWWMRAIGPSQIEALEHPAMQNGVDVNSDLQRTIRSGLTLLHAGLKGVDKYGAFEKEPFKWINDLNLSDKGSAAVNEMFLTQNKEKRLLTNQEVATLAKDKGAMDHLGNLLRARDGFERAYKTANMSLFLREVDGSAHAIAVKLGSHLNLSATQLYTLGETVSKAVAARDGNAIREIMQLHKLTPEQMDMAVSTAMPLMKIANELKAGLDARQGYTSESRDGPHQLVWYDKEGKSGFFGHQTEAGAKARAAKLENDPNVQKGSIQYRYEPTKYAERMGSDDQLMKLIDRIEAEKKKIIASDTNLSDVQKQKLMDELNFSDQLKTEIATARKDSFMKPRKFAPGREHIDMVASNLDNLRAITQLVARTSARRRQSILEYDGSLRENPELLERAKQMVEQELTPDSPATRVATKAIFHWFLGGNPSSLMVNMFDSMMRLPYFLTSQGSGITESYGHLMAGYKVVRQYAMDKMGLTSSMPKEYRALIEWAQLGNLLGHGVFDEVTGNRDLAAVNERRNYDGLPSWKDKAPYLAKPLAWYNDAARALFSSSEMVNGISSLVAGYRLSKELNPRAKEIDHYKFAERTLRSTQAGGGKGNRPELISKLPASGVVSSLSNYAYNTFALSGHILSQAIGKTMRGENGASQARKAAIHMLGSMGAFAGVLGMPAVGAAVALIDKQFPEAELNKHLRVGLAKLFGESAETGHTMTDVALKGLPTALLGVDLSGRIGVGGVLGLNEQNGFDVAHLFGPAYSIVANWSQALGMASRGEYARATETAAPTALKNILKTFREGGMAQDSQGNALIPLSGGEQLLRLTGFNPNRLARIRDEKSMISASNAAEKLKQQDFVRQLAASAMQGDISGVNLAITQKVAEDPRFTRQQLLQAVVGEIDRRTTPYDPFEHAGMSGDVARTFDAPAGRGQVQKKKDVNAVRGSLGMKPTATTPAGSRKAATEDMLINSRGMSLMEAQRLLQRSGAGSVY